MSYRRKYTAVKLTQFIIINLLFLLITGPLQAASFQQVEKTTQFNMPGEVHSVTPLNDNLMLLAAEGTGVVLADFSQPEQPRIVNTARQSAQAEAIAVSSSGRRIYVANGSGGLDIFALSTNGELRLLGRLDTPSYAFDVTVSSDNKVVYIADNTNGVVVADVSHSAQPRIIATIPTKASAAGVQLSPNGQTLYIAEQADGIHIVNVRTPFSPHTITRLKTRGHAQSLALSTDGRRLFSANNTGGLQVFEVSQPQSARLIGQLAIQNAFGITVSADNRTLLVADLFNGLKTVNVSRPSNPVQLAAVKTGGTAENSVVLPDRRIVLVAAGKTGVSVIQFR